MNSISRLFGLYRQSPFWLRNIAARLTWPLRLAMFPFSRIRVGGHQMHLDFLDNASFKYYTDRENYELVEKTAFLASIVHNPGCYVLDIGASYGAFTLAAAGLAPLNVLRGIHAFEPDRRPSAALRKSVARNRLEKIAQVHRVIVSDTDGQQRLFVNARSSADNRSHQVTTAPISVRETYDVPSRTIDSFLKDAGIPLNSKFIIKMDIQGNEARAFRGMKQLLEQASGVMFFFEHFPYLIRSAGVDQDSYLKFLRTVEADAYFEFYRGMRPLADYAAFEASVRGLENRDEARIEGPGADYVISRNMNLAGLSAVHGLGDGSEKTYLQSHTLGELKDQRSAA